MSDTATRLAGIGPAGVGDVPSVGRRIGEFHVVRELGRGSMGVVYEAVQIGLNRRVALKVLNPTMLNEDGIARFRREAEILARLDHPNVVRVFSVGQVDGLPYYAMEYVDGTSLDVVLRMGRVRLARAVDISAQAAAGLACVHAAGIVHRDVKPSNILVAKDERIVLTDFGLARGEEGSHLTATGEVIGTPMYMAPEQACGLGHLADARSDIFSLGATIYEVIAGRPPFQGDEITAVLHRVAHEEPPTLRTLDRGVPPDLNAIVMTCLAKDPAARYANGAELKDDLDRFRRGEPVRARPPGPIARLGKWIRRHRIISAASAVVLITGVVAAAYGWRVKARQGALRVAIESSSAREREGRPRDALATLEAALLEHGADPALGTALARMRLRFHDPEAALAELDRGATAGALPPEAAVLRARAELELGRPEAALRALDAQPSAPGAARVRAWALRALDRPEEGLEVLDAASKAPGADAAEVAGDTAEMLLALGRDEAALAALERVRRDSIRLHFLWTEAQVRVGLDGDAQEAVAESLRRIGSLARDDAPWIDRVRVYVSRWRAHEWTDREEELEAKFRESLRSGLLDPPIDVEAALLFAWTEDHADRESFTKKVLAEDRYCAEIKLLHGLALLGREDGGKHAQAKRDIEHALEMDRRSIPARFALGRLLLENGVVGEAVSHLEAVRVHRSDDPSVLQALGRAYLLWKDSEGRLSRAEEGRRLLADAAARIQTKGWGAWLHRRGLAYFGLALSPGEDFAADKIIWKARHGFAKALLADPEIGPAIAEIGRAIFVQAALDPDQNAFALACVERALALNPFDAEAHLLRVAILREGAEPRDLTRALKAADEAVAVLADDPDRGPRARLERALVHVARREWSEALLDLDVVGSRYPIAHHARAEALEGLGRKEEARKAWTAWEEAPTSREAERWAAFYLAAGKRASRRKSDLWAALRLVDRARKEAPRYPPVYNELAEVQKDLGLHVEAFSSYAKALRLDEAMYGARFYTKAYQFRVFMLAEQALEKVRRLAAEAPPGDVSLHLALAFVCSLTARENIASRQEGILALDRVLGVDPKFATARGLRALLIGWDGRVEEGLREIDLARRDAPGLALLRYFEARLYAKAGRTEEARAALADAVAIDRAVESLIGLDADTDGLR